MPTREFRVTCKDHAGPQECYIVCPHVMPPDFGGDGSSVAHHLRASAAEMGEMLCGACRDAMRSGSKSEVERVVASTKIVCKPCALKITKGRLPA